MRQKVISRSQTHVLGRCIGPSHKGSNGVAKGINHLVLERLLLDYLSLPGHVSILPFPHDPDTDHDACLDDIEYADGDHDLRRVFEATACV